MPNPFNRLARGESYPGTCLRCKRDADLVDLGADDIPQFGTVYLCWVCTAELFDTFGMVPRSDITIVEAEANQLIGGLKDRITALLEEHQPETLNQEDLSDALAAHRAAGAALDRLAGRAADPRSVDAEPVITLADFSDGRRRPLNVSVFRADAGAPAGDERDGGEDDGRDGGVAEGGDVWDALGAPVPDEADR